MKKIVETSCSIYLGEFLQGPEVEIYFENDLHEHGHLEVYHVENRSVGSKVAWQLAAQLEGEGFRVTNYVRSPRM